jgi:hypothetical protein
MDAQKSLDEVVLTANEPVSQAAAWVLDALDTALVRVAVLAALSLGGVPVPGVTLPARSRTRR